MNHMRTPADQAGVRACDEAVFHARSINLSPASDIRVIDTDVFSVEFRILS